MKAEFPEVFIKDDFIYLSCEKRKACSDGLKAWALVMMKNKPPKQFGEGMVKISKLLGIPAYAESLKKYANDNL